MEMEIIDTVQAYTLELGDYIEFEGAICAIKEIDNSLEDETSAITFISEDDRERSEFWFNVVEIYGYSSVEV